MFVLEDLLLDNVNDDHQANIASYYDSYYYWFLSEKEAAKIITAGLEFSSFVLVVVVVDIMDNQKLLGIIDYLDLDIGTMG